MANLLETFLIRFALQDGGVKRGLVTIQKEVQKTTDAVEKNTDVSAKSGKALAESGQKGAEAFANFRREAAGALALFTGGRAIKALIKDTTDANVALGNLSKTLDLPASKLTGYSFLSIANGGKGNEIQGMLSHLRQMTTSVEGRAELGALSTSLFNGQVNFTDANGRLRKDVFEQIHNSSIYQSRPAETQLQINKMLGGSEATWAALADPRFAEALRQFSKFGPTNEQIQTSREFKYDWTELSGTNQKILYDVVSGLQKELDPFIKGLTAIEQANPGAIGNGLLVIANALAFIGGLKIFKSLYGASTRAIAPIAESAALSASAFAAEAAYIMWPKTLGKNDTVNPKSLGPMRLSVADQTALFFKKKGYSREQIAAILGNISQESSFNPKRLNPDEDAFGLFQWRPARQADYKKWSGGKDLKDATVLQQLEWADHELKTTGWARNLHNATNERDAVSALIGYENPKNPYKELDLRWRKAMAFKDVADKAFNNSAPDNSVHIGKVVINTPTNDPLNHAREFQRHIKSNRLHGAGGQM